MKKQTHLLFIVLIFGFFTNAIFAQVSDLSLEKSINNKQASLGDSVIFTVELLNSGPDLATSIEVLDKLPVGYTLNDASTTLGKYNNDTGVWSIKTLPKQKSAILTINATVTVGEHMNLAQVISCNQNDPDSTPNNGVDTDGDENVEDDPNDEDDGDGQSIYDINTDSDSSSNSGSDLDIKMVMNSKKDKQIFFLDFDTMAMRLEFHSKRKNPDPIFFDKDGYVYSGEKNNYYKIPFGEMKKIGNLVNFFSLGKLPPVRFPEGPTYFNGHELNLSPNKYPIIEWAFVYKPEVFRGAENMTEETVDCRGFSNCTKFTVNSGKGSGSFILFDHENRLAEISTHKDGSAIYTYEPCTVTLPAAQKMDFPMSKMIFKN